MSAHPTVPHVARARPPEIDDQLLGTITDIAERAREGRCTAHEANVFLHAAPELLDELSRRRKAMDTIRAMATIDNVVFLSGGGKPGDAA